jgi:hypothetical protein
MRSADQADQGGDMNKQTAALAIVVAMAVFGLLRLRGGLFGKDVRSAAFLSQVAAKVNKDLPRTIDAETELSSVAGLEGILVYNYRLVNATAADMDVKQFLGIMTPQVTNVACTNPATRDQFIKKGITLRYTYADKSGVAVASFDVTPALCHL